MKRDIMEMNRREDERIRQGIKSIVQKATGMEISEEAISQIIKVEHSRQYFS
jgi:hypothetical protein